MLFHYLFLIGKEKFIEVFVKKEGGEGGNLCTQEGYKEFLKRKEKGKKKLTIATP